MEILVAILIATMMLINLCTGVDASKSISTTTSTSGFEAAFAAAGLLAVTFAALRRKAPGIS